MISYVNIAIGIAIGSCTIASKIPIIKGKFARNFCLISATFVQSKYGFDKSTRYIIEIIASTTRMPFISNTMKANFNIGKSVNKNNKNGILKTKLNFKFVSSFALTNSFSKDIEDLKDSLFLFYALKILVL